MRTILLSVLILTTINCFSQRSFVDDIKIIEEIINFNNNYTFQYIDSIKFKHPYLTAGRSLGTIIVKNTKYPEYQLRYNIIEYSNKDSISHQLDRLNGLSSATYLSPFRSGFYYGKYLFFMNWYCPYWPQLDDRCKYMSLKIYDNIENVRYTP